MCSMKRSLDVQSVVATGGVYKGQGLNQHELMTRAYWEFLVHGKYNCCKAHNYISVTINTKNTQLKENSTD